MSVPPIIFVPAARGSFGNFLPKLPAVPRALSPRLQAVDMPHGADKAEQRKASAKRRRSRTLPDCGRLLTTLRSLPAPRVNLLIYDSQQGARYAGASGWGCVFCLASGSRTRSLGSPFFSPRRVGTGSFPVLPRGDLLLALFFLITARHSREMTGKERRLLSGTAATPRRMHYAWASNKFTALLSRPRTK